MIIDYNSSKIVGIGEQLGWFDEYQRDILLLAPSPLIDRTETINVGLPVSIIDRIPDRPTNKTFEEICQEQAQRIIQLNMPIEVYWSGGIDSTLVLVSLLKAGAKDLTVVLNGMSIIEYPLFYKNFLEGKVNIRRSRPSIVNIIDHTKLIVTGEHGDQINGSDLIFRPDNFEVFKSDWKDVTASVFSNRYVEFFEPLMAKAPFDINSYFDAVWWMNFTCKWQHAKLRMSGSENPIEFAGKVQHFFSHPDFQAWSINETNHRTLKIKDTKESYKHEMKRIIAEFTGDFVYRDTKLKVGSLKVYNGDMILKLADGTIQNDTSLEDLNKYSEMIRIHNENHQIK